MQFRKASMIWFKKALFECWISAVLGLLFCLYCGCHTLEYEASAGTIIPEEPTATSLPGNFRRVPERRTVRKSKPTSSSDNSSRPTRGPGSLGYEFKNTSAATLVVKEPPGVLQSSAISAEPVQDDEHVNCNTTSRKSEGLIVSPGYPSAYSPNQHCIYTIKLYPENGNATGVRFMFLDFDLETGHDWLTIGVVERDRESDSGTGTELPESGSPRILHMVTGPKAPPEMTVESNEIVVVFHSDENMENAGFFIHYTVQKSDQNMSLVPPGKAFHWRGVAGAQADFSETRRMESFRLAAPEKTADPLCSGVGKPLLLEDLKGIVLSPGYLQNQTYDNDLHCRWRINGPENSMVRVTAKHASFATELLHDVLQLTQFEHDVFPETGTRLLSSTSGDEPVREAVHGTVLASLSGRSDQDLTYLSPLPVVQLDFFTDGSVGDRGFQLEYEIIPQNVSTIVLNLNSSLLVQSSGYPSDYPVNQKLTWIVHGPAEGMVVRVVDLELDQEAGDSLSIGKGDAWNPSQTVAKLTGSLTDKSARISVSDSRALFLHFASHHHTRPRRGWILTCEPLEPFDEEPGRGSAGEGFSSPTQTKLIERRFNTLVASSTNKSLSTGTTSGNVDIVKARNYSGPKSWKPLVELTSPKHSAGMTFAKDLYGKRPADVMAANTYYLMEVDVELLKSLKFVEWQENLRLCLNSLLPRSLFTNGRSPVLTTSVLQWRNPEVVRVVVGTTTSGMSFEGDDSTPDSDMNMFMKDNVPTSSSDLSMASRPFPILLAQQLRSTLALGRVRCNESLELYLPEYLEEVQREAGTGHTPSGQNWLLASVCIIGFFLITFSAVLFMHCKHRRVIVRKLKFHQTSSLSPLCSTPQINSFRSHRIPSRSPFPTTPQHPFAGSERSKHLTVHLQNHLSVVMEPSMQRNPLFELRRSGNPIADRSHRGHSAQKRIPKQANSRSISATPTRSLSVHDPDFDTDIEQYMDRAGMSPDSDSGIRSPWKTKEKYSQEDIYTVEKAGQDDGSQRKPCPPLWKQKQGLQLVGVHLGGTGISQKIPSLTQGYDRRLEIVAQPNAAGREKRDDETVSVRTPSDTSDHLSDCECQLEAESGEVIEEQMDASVRLESTSTTESSLGTLLNALTFDWRNGRPMTVRALKQKSHLKKQIRSGSLEEDEIPEES